MSKRTQYYYAKLACELRYDRVMPDIAKRIKKCKTEIEVSRILADCRHMMTERERLLGI